MGVTPRRWELGCGAGAKRDAHRARQPRTVRADRFAVPESAWPDQGALLLVREGLGVVPLVVALSRDGGVEEQILALD
ncbi:MAG: hypothetical protein RIT28_5132 [Pseudomonadota bacterium]